MLGVVGWTRAKSSIYIRSFHKYKLRDCRCRFEIQLVLSFSPSRTRHILEGLVSQANGEDSVVRPDIVYIYNYAAQPWQPYSLHMACGRVGSPGVKPWVGVMGKSITKAGPSGWRFATALFPSIHHDALVWGSEYQVMPWY